MPKWTQQQNNAITARGRNILVSAPPVQEKPLFLLKGL